MNRLLFCLYNYISFIAVSPIELSAKICDIRKACNIVNGPNITVKYNEMTRDEFSSIVEEIREAFRRTDFAEGNNLILMGSITYQVTKVQCKTFAFIQLNFILLIQTLNTQIN